VKLTEHPLIQKTLEREVNKSYTIQKTLEIEVIKSTRMQKALECEANITSRISEASFKTECSYYSKDSMLTLSTNLQTHR
jgi:hypothetical protein